MAEQIRISVIIPFYNDELYIEECVRSAMAQTEQRLEIICVNDGSMDNSEAIVRKCAEEDKRIKVLRQENQGLSGARNTGIGQAKGEFICFLDADDRLKADACSELYVQALTSQAEIVTFDGDCFFQEPELYDEKRKNYYIRSRSYGFMEGIQMFTEMRRNGDYCDSAWLLFLNRQWLLSKEITFYPWIYHEDGLFTFQCMLRCKRVLHINQPLYERRIHDGSITTIPKTARHLYGKMICHTYFYGYLHTEELKEDQATALADFSRTMVREMKEILSVLPEEEYQKLLNMRFTPVMRLSLEQAGIAWKETAPVLKDRDGKDNLSMVNVEAIVQKLQEEIAEKKGCKETSAPKNSKLAEKLADKEKIVIVGSGNFGLQCYELLRDDRPDRVLCFADNGYEKYSYGLMGKKVISLEEAVDQYSNAHFIVTPKYHFMDIIRQLESLGLSLDQIDCWIGF